MFIDPGKIQADILSFMNLRRREKEERNRELRHFILILFRIFPIFIFVWIVLPSVILPQKYATRCQRNEIKVDRSVNLFLDECTG